MTVVREPVVAGAFYPGTPAALSKTVGQLFGAELQGSAESLSDSVGLIVPHAGYMYSGPTAAVGYRYLAMLGRPAWAIILGTNHTGMGHPISIAREGAWRTPFGEAPIASDLADRLVAEGLEVAQAAFLREHSIEVQLPFLQFLFGATIPFVPVCVKLAPLSELVSTGEAIVRAIRDGHGAVIASSDFTHYEPTEIARRIDCTAIDHILALDVEGFYRKLVDERLSICGGGAITVLMSIAQRSAWNQTRLLSYTTSGDVTGDHSAVVGYAAIAFGGAHD